MSITEYVEDQWGFQVYTNLALSPLQAGSSKRALKFSASEEHANLPHYRPGQGPGAAPFDIAQIDFDPDLPVEESDFLPGTTVYAGVYLRHFGHFIAECIHRLYAVHEDPALHDAKIAFHSWGTQRHQIEPWLEPILRACGIDFKRVRFIDRNTRFERLIVPKQARLLGGVTLKPDYATMFPPAFALPKPSSRQDIYMSRSRHLYSGGFAGEALLDKIMAEAGFEIVFPEDLPLDELLPKLASAKNILLSEGSSIHNLELCGKLDASLMIIARRAQTRGRFGDLPLHHSSRFHVFESITELGSLEWEPQRNGPSRSRVLSLINLPELVRNISQFFEVSLRVPDREICERAIYEDIARYIMHPKLIRKNNTTDEELGRLLKLMRKRFAASEVI
ncbi:glycosyltransferase family 61 protein [Rhodobacter sp. NTK016B]|uniref:glycosyltransferase 61 family protein n=1 Tax=Rhodobacter sp. NTK016B TaxID=2759676 RepID=UPI001A8DCADD|nr:glycosyltransferase family 61 protein [Rhodobacter sp. NTK016B]MBN8294898.1 glycosyltransferase family 61 protein [Rhodobacter sp. NTK016B]